MLHQRREKHFPAQGKLLRTQLLSSLVSTKSRHCLLLFCDEIEWVSYALLIPKWNCT